MKEVIRIDDNNEENLSLTHFLTEGDGWQECPPTEPLNLDKIVYLGKDSLEGDMFACYDGGCIHIYKGHLNNGKYESRR